MFLKRRRNKPYPHAKHTSNLAICNRFPSRRAFLLRPGEVNNRRHEEAITAIRNTSKGIIPSQESTQQSEETACLDYLFIRHAIHIKQISNGEQKQREIDEEEEGKESNGGFEGKHRDQRGEDEPALEKKRGN